MTGYATASRSRPRRSGSSAAWRRGGSAISTTGTLHEVELEVSWTPSPLVTLFARRRAQRRAACPRATSTLTLVGAKIRLNLSPDLQFNSFLQYDTRTGLSGRTRGCAGRSVRAGDLFVIYNHNLRDLDHRWRATRTSSWSSSSTRSGPDVEGGIGAGLALRWRHTLLT